MKLKTICIFTLLYAILTFFPVHNLPPIEIKLEKIIRIVFETTHYLIFCVFLISSFMLLKGSKLKKLYLVLAIPLVLYTISGIFVSYANQGQTYEDVRIYYSNKSKSQIIEQLYSQGVHGTESRLVVIEKDFNRFRIFKRVDETEFEK